MLQNLNSNTQASELAAPTNYTGVNLDGAKGFSIVAVISVTTPSAGAFTAAVSNICTKAAHLFKTGLKVQVSTTTTLPGGLAAATDYFVIYLSANTFSLASSLALAQAGTAISITTTGTGTHTVTPTALAGGTVKLQASQDDSNYVDVASASSNVTATGNVLFNVGDPFYKFVRVVYTLTAGQISVSQVTRVIGN